MAENTNPLAGTAFADLANLDEAAGYISPTLEQSRALAAALMAQRPGRVSDLAALAKARESAYADILGGGNKDLAKLGFLTSLGERGFAYAANVDPTTGQPLRGSALSRFAGAARGLPGEMLKMAAAQKKEDQAIKLAAMQSAEKTIAAEREANQKLMEEQYKFAREDIKAAGKAGKITGTPFNQYQELITPWVQGTLDNPGKIRLINAVTEMVKPVTYTDKMNNLVTKRADIPRTFFDGLVSNYGQEAADAWLKSLGPDVKVSSIAYPQVPELSETPPTGTQAAEPTVQEPVVSSDLIGERTPEGAQKVAEAYRLPPSDPSRPKLWDVRSYLAGPINTLQSFVSANVPGMPPDVIDKTRKDALKANEGLIEALATNEGRVSVDEMNRLRGMIGLSPRVFGGEGAMSTALVSLDDTLKRERENYANIANNPDKYLARDISNARTKMNLIDTYRLSLGIPQSIFSDDQLQALPAGAEFVDKRDPNAFGIGRKDTFSYRSMEAVKNFQAKNPGKEFVVILPSGKEQKFIAPGKTK